MDLSSQSTAQRLMKTMNKILLLLAMIAARSVGLKDIDSDNCKDIQSKSPSLRLKKHLFCDYDPLVQPTLDTIRVSVLFIPKFIDFDSYGNNLNFHTWVILTWNDKHLQWNPDEFAKLESYHVKSDEIWTPDFSVFNTGGGSVDPLNFPTSECILLNNGTVQCAVGQSYTTHCPADFVDWPFDEHNCTLHFGSWMHFRGEMTFDFTDDSILMHELIPNQEWDVKINNLTQADQVYGTDSDSMIFMSVIIRRHPGRARLIFISPMIALIILTLTVLCLDSRSFERIAMACSNFVCHLMCLFDMHWYMPTNGAINTPKILLFYEASISIAAFTLIFTSVARKIYSINVPAPQFISSVTAAIIDFPASRFLGLRIAQRKNPSTSSAAEDEQTKEKDQVWVECASILEWLAFIFVSAAYIILFAVLLPKSPIPLLEKYRY